MTATAPRLAATEPAPPRPFPPRVPLPRIEALSFQWRQDALRGEIIFDGRLHAYRDDRGSWHVWRPLWGAPGRGMWVTPTDAEAQAFEALAAESRKTVDVSGIPLR